MKKKHFWESACACYSNTKLSLFQTDIYHRDKQQTKTKTKTNRKKTPCKYWAFVLTILVCLCVTFTDTIYSMLVMFSTHTCGFCLLILVLWFYIVGKFLSFLIWTQIVKQHITRSVLHQEETNTVVAVVRSRSHISTSAHKQFSENGQRYNFWFQNKIFGYKFVWWIA